MEVPKLIQTSPQKDSDRWTPNKNTILIFPHKSFFTRFLLLPDSLLNWPIQTHLNLHMELHKLHAHWNKDTYTAYLILWTGTGYKCKMFYFETNKSRSIYVTDFCKWVCNITKKTNLKRHTSFAGYISSYLHIYRSQLCISKLNIYITKKLQRKVMNLSRTHVCV